MRARVVKRSGRQAVGGSARAVPCRDLGSVVRLDPAGGLGRLCRASVFAALSLVLAIGAHRAAGGTVSFDLVVWALVVLALAGWFLARRQRSGGSIAVLVVGSQLLLHLSFAVPALLPLLRSRGRPPAGALAALFLCHHSVVTAAQVRAATRGIDAHQLADVAGTSSPNLAAIVAAALPMVAAHVAAAAAMAWWLNRGERALWAAACRAVGTLTGGLHVAPVPSAGDVALGYGPCISPSRRCGSWLTRRGPPPAVARLRLA